MYRNNKNLYFPEIPGIPEILKIISRSTGKSKGREIEMLRILSMMQPQTAIDLRICVKTGEDNCSKINNLLIFEHKYIILYIDRWEIMSALNKNRVHIFLIAPIIEKNDKTRVFPDKTVPGIRDPGRTR